MVKEWNTCQHTPGTKYEKWYGFLLNLPPPLASRPEESVMSAPSMSRWERRLWLVEGGREQLSLIPLKMLRLRLVWPIPHSQQQGQSSFPGNHCDNGGAAIIPADQVWLIIPGFPPA